MAEKLAASAVILNHNDNENTLRLAGEFANMDIVGKTVIVDNTGQNGISSVHGVKTVLIRCPNDGYASGNNRGLAFIDSEGGAEFIIISNPDVYVSDEAVTACVDFLRKNPGYAEAAPRMCDASGRPHHLSAWKERTFLCDLAYSSGMLSRIIGMCRECYDGDYLEKPAADVDCAAGSFFVIRSRALKEAGNFDEHTFLYYEEDILGFKLKRLGYKTAILGNYKFIHSEGSSVKKSLNLLKKYLSMQKSRLYFHRRYLKTPWPLYFVLLLATGLGIVEKVIKTLYYKASGN